MTLFRTFFSLLSHEFKIPIQEIEKEWSVIEEGYTSYYPYDKVVINLCDPTPIAIPVGNIEKKCLHEFVRSAKKGSLCGERTTSGDFCNKHKKQHKNQERAENVSEKYEKDEKDEKKKTPKKEKTELEELEKYTPQEPLHSNIKQPISIRLNYKINRYIHPDSGMTFFSKEEKVVFARFDKNKCRLLKLTEDDIVLCKMYSFRVDPNKWDIQNIQNIQNIENNGDNEIQE